MVFAGVLQEGRPSLQARALFDVDTGTSLTGSFFCRTIESLRLRPSSFRGQVAMWIVTQPLTLGMLSLALIESVARIALMITLEILRNVCSSPRLQAFYDRHRAHSWGACEDAFKTIAYALVAFPSQEPGFLSDEALRGLEEFQREVFSEITQETRRLEENRAQLSRALAEGLSSLEEEERPLFSLTINRMLAITNDLEIFLERAILSPNTSLEARLRHLERSLTPRIEEVKRALSVLQRAIPADFLPNGLDSTCIERLLTQMQRLLLELPNTSIDLSFRDRRTLWLIKTLVCAVQGFIHLGYKLELFS